MKCEDAEPMCPSCHGKCDKEAYTFLYRTDQHDSAETAMCVACAEDAMESGLFREEDE